MKLDPAIQVVELETASACNRACSYCPNSIATRPSRGAMSEDLFGKIVDDLASLDFDGRLSFHFYNEPLLDRRLPRLVARAAEALPRARIKLFTNGDRLSSDRFRQLVAAGVKRFTITEHEGGSKAIAGLMEALTHEERALIQLQRHTTLNLSNRGGILRSIAAPGRPLTVSCGLPAQRLIVTLTGNVVLCAEDYFERVVLGNLRTQRIEEVWTCERFEAIRRRLAAGDRSCTEICRGCSNTSVPAAAMTSGEE